MAIYHLSMKVITRGKGRSAVAAAAYRAGEIIRNDYDGKLHDYTRRSGVLWTGILLPENAPHEYKERAVLWNAVEQKEKASNSQLAREIEIALPRELHFSEYFPIVRQYVKENFTDKGMIADIAIHNTKNENPHFHILLTTRPLNQDKTWGDKQKKVYHYDENGEKIYDPKKRQYKCGKVQTTDWNERHKAEEWRESWAVLCNKYLGQYGHAERIDHRSYKRQGIDKIPTIHLGTAAHQMEQRGILTERGNINRAIEISNRKLRKIEAELNDLQGWLVEERAKPEPQTEQAQMPHSSEPKQPTFADIIADILSRQNQTVANAATAAQILAFLKANSIKSYDDLVKHLQDLMGQQRSIAHDFAPLRKRKDQLVENIKQYDNYTKRKAQHKQYQADLAKQKPWQKKAFERDNNYYVIQFDEAKRTIDKLRNGKGKIPINAWKKEYDNLSLELRELDRDYQQLKNDVAQVDKIRTTVYDVLRRERQREQPVQKRSHNAERV